MPQFEEAGVFEDGTPYRMTVPADWNGVLVNDLDYVMKAGGDGPQGLGDGSRALLRRGYALSGIGRHARRRAEYDPAREIDHLLSVLDLFEKCFEPARLRVQYGSSGGGHVALAMAELHGDRIAGAAATCAHTPVLTAGQRFDLFLALKTLLAPNTPNLQFANLAEYDVETPAAWEKLLLDAVSKPEGRARIALAFAFVQWPYWTTDESSNPSGRGDDALSSAMIATALSLPKILPGQFMYERQGAVVGSVAAAYDEYWSAADEGARAFAERMYDKAKIDLSADLARLAKPESLSPDRAAMAHWYQHTARTVQGRPTVPVFRMHTTGDGLIAIAQMRVYQDLVDKNGADAFYRAAVVDRAGHCKFSVGEYVAALEIVMKRIETGAWPDTSARSLNAFSATFDDSGDHRFVEHSIGPYNGSWRLSEPR
ncbi:MAG: hypothetical protein ABW199_11585 [Caulobacterales bacterium]